MYFENHLDKYNVLLVGRESDIGVLIDKTGDKLKIHLTLRESVVDQTAHDKTLDPRDALSVIYKLWTDGELFPVKTLIHLQNDLIEYLQDQLLTVESTGGKPNGNSKKRADE